MKPNSFNYTIFDIGSTKISVIDCYIDRNGSISLNADTIKKSQGFRSGAITNMKLAENTIIQSIFDIEKSNDKSIKEASIAISGANVKSYYVKTHIKLTNQPISEQDIKKLLDQALLNFKIPNKKIIHYFPIEYIVNGNQIVDDPLDLYARTLECQLHIIAADSSTIMNIVTCFKKCQVQINELILSIYAAGQSCLTQDEMKLGALLIDIGSHTTSAAVFLDNKIIYTTYLEQGGIHLTTDIAKKFSISIETAEKLKTTKGHAKLDTHLKDSLIRLDTPINDENTPLSITKKQLSSVIEKRLSNILSALRNNCQKLENNEMIPQNIVLTGGTASLIGIKNLTAEIFHKQVRIAKPIQPSSNSLKVRESDLNIYSTIFGILRLKSEYNKQFYQNHPLGTSLFKRILAYFLNFK